MEIKILGAGCPKCRRLEALVRQVADELGADATFTKVKEMDEIMSHDVISAPALVIDEGIKVSGGFHTEKRSRNGSRPHRASVISSDSETCCAG